MQVPPLDMAQLASIPSVSGVPARIVAGNPSLVPLGALLEATVTSVTPREASLLINGQTLTIRTPNGVQLQPGAVLLARVPPSSPNSPNPTLELSPANAARVPPAGQQAQQAQQVAQLGGQQATGGTTPRTADTTAGVATVLPDAVSRSASSAPPSTTRGIPDAPTSVVATPGASRPVVVDVLSALPDGRVRVQINGEEQTARSSQPLTPGGRYVVQVERTPAGLTLRPLPDSPKLPTEVATAILRTTAPSLPAALKPLQAELATFTTPQPTGTSRPVPVAVRDAAVAVRDTLNSFLPTDQRTPDAQELQKLVENGGLHYEAKLARLGEPDAAPTRIVAPKADAPETKGTTSTTEATEATNGKNTTKVTDNATPQSTTTTKATPGSERPTQEPLTTAQAPNRPVGADLKGDLLRLLQTVQDLGGAVQAPAAQTALHGIEAQQATNTLAQTNNVPYLLQIPFPDGGELRTLSLSLEPQNRPDQPDAEQAGRFRMFMHVPLSDLGETWIDAGLAGDRFRATIYLDRASVRDRVRAALPELRTELTSDGFSEVLLDVRSSDELPSRQKREASAMQAGRPDTVTVLDVRV